MQLHQPLRNVSTRVRAHERPQRLSGVYQAMRVDGVPDRSAKQVDTLLWISAKMQHWELFDALLATGGNPRVVFSDSVTPACCAIDLWFALLEGNVGRTVALVKWKRGIKDCL